MLARVGARVMHPLVAFIAALVFIGLVLWVVTAKVREGETIMPARDGAVTSVATDVTADELTAVARTRVFFGHQSVGMNVLSALPAVFSARNVQAPPIAEKRTDPGTQGGFVAHAFIGENEKPLLKLQDFDRQLRSGMAGKVDVAMMKFCYVDVSSDTDVEALFARYRDTMEALERDFPGVTFVKVTVPLTTEPDLRTVVKGWLGRALQYGKAANVKREQFNELLRRQYGEDYLFDIAAVESTIPDGRQVGGDHDGMQYHALFSGYAADQGHLNAVGAERAAAAWAKAVAAASKK